MVTSQPQQTQAAEPRSQVVEEPTPKLGGPTYKEVTPKTYQVLQDELPQCAQEGERQLRPSHIVKAISSHVYPPYIDTPYLHMDPDILLKHFRIPSVYSKLCPD